MERREFLASAAGLAAAGVAFESPARAAQPQTGAKFRLKYGPHLGMFKHHAGEDHTIPRPEGYRQFETEAVHKGLGRLAAAAGERGVDMPTLAFAWILSDPRVTAVVTGPRRPEHLQPAVAALDLRLSPAERDELASFFP